MEGGHNVLFICLNPSTADETGDDPTSRRCIAFARAWGFASLTVANLFAYRTTSPKKLRTAPDPVGTDNDRWLMELSSKADLTIFAWGNQGGFLNRDKVVIPLIRNPYCLARTRDDSPAHPLYLPRSLKPIRF